MYFWWLVDVLMLRRLGLAKPFRYMLLLLFAGCFVAGMIYTYVFLNAAIERSHDTHVHAQSTH